MKLLIIIGAVYIVAVLIFWFKVEGFTNKLMAQIIAAAILALISLWISVYIESNVHHEKMKEEITVELSNEGNVIFEGEIISGYRLTKGKSYKEISVSKSDWMLWPIEKVTYYIGIDVLEEGNDGKVEG